MNKQGGLSVCISNSLFKAGIFLVKEFQHSKLYKKLCFFMPAILFCKIKKVLFVCFLVCLFSCLLFSGQAANAQQTMMSAESAIKQKSLDVAKQIEIYLTLNKDKTLADLQADEYFQNIAVQKVGETGYTAVTDYDTLVNAFHVNPKIVNTDLSALAEKLPGFWSIISRTQGGKEVGGIYDWQEIDGSIKQKYMYISVVKTRTADGIGLNVAATTYLEEYDENNIIKKKAAEIAGQIETYLKTNPQMKVSDLQNDAFFKSIALQTIGETGYTGLLDSRTGYFYFHPQEKLVNTDSHQLSEKLPDWWNIFKQSIGETCQDSSGIYDWTEADGKTTKKFLATSCVKIPSADGKYLFVAATNYLDKDEGIRYLQQYEVKPGFSFAQDSINQRALDIAKQIELYIKANPQKKLDDLRQDKDFQALAVQTIGKTGYTYLITHETGILNFHPDVKIRDTSYNSFKDRFPVIWDIINQSVRANPCQDSSGFYKWADINGVVRDKYTYHHCIDAKTADGFSFFIGASTYLDEYSGGGILGQSIDNYQAQQAFPIYVLWVFGFLIVLVIILSLLQFFGLIKIRGAAMYIILVFFFVIISGLFIISSVLTIRNLRGVFLDTYVEQQHRISGLQTEKIIEQIKTMGVELKLLADSEGDAGVGNYELSDLLRSARERSHGYVYAAYRISKDGLIASMYPVDKDSLEADISEQAHMTKIKETKQPVLSDVFDAVEGFQGVTLHYPVLKNGEYDGTVAFLINIDDLFKELNLLDKGAGSQVFFLFDKNRKIILSDNKEYLGKNIQEIGRYSALNNIFETIIKSKQFSYLITSIEDEEYVVTYQPVELEDNTYFILIGEQTGNVYLVADKTLNNIWWFTALTLLSLIVLGIFLAYFLTFSLRAEVEKQTKVVEQKAKQIEIQLKKEAEINKEKERLLLEQKKAKQELEEKIDELERFQQITIDRELKMIELKKRIDELK